MNPASRSGLLLTLGAVLIWGTQLPIAKGAMADLDGLTLTLIRYGLALGGLYAALAWRERIASLRLDGRGGLVAAAGAIGMAGSGLLVFLGLSLTRPEVAVIIIALQPAITAIAEWALKGKRPAPFTLGCLVAAFLGVAIVITRGGTGLPGLVRSSPRELLGNALVFAGASAWVGYALMAERLRGWSSLRISAHTCLAAVVALLAVWLLALAHGAAQLPAAESLLRHAWRLAFLGVLGVLIALLMWNAGIRRIGPLDAMLLTNLMPVTTFVYRALEGASFVASELAGAAVVVGALLSNNLFLRRGLRPAGAAAPSATGRRAP